MGKKITHPTLLPRELPGKKSWLRHTVGARRAVPLQHRHHLQGWPYPIKPHPTPVISTNGRNLHRNCTTEISPFGRDDTNGRTTGFMPPPHQQRRVGTAVGAHPTLLLRGLPGKILAAAHRRGTARRALQHRHHLQGVAVPHKTTFSPCHFDQREKSPSRLHNGDLSLRSR